MPKGNPNPSPSTRFKKGQSGNPGGLTSDAKLMSLANAETAIRIRNRVLRAAEAKLNECSTDEVLEQFVEAAMLKLLTDSETRGLGAPVQAIDHTTNGKDINQQPAIIAALDRKHRDT